ncbi:MAG: glycosyltransferase family 87 protein [Sphingomicrobium sp.]
MTPGEAAENRSTADPWAGTRGVVLRFGLMFAALAIGNFLLLPFIATQIYFRDYLGDFQLFWHMSQYPMTALYAEVPFPYPPTGLLLIRPFGLLPFPAALIAWSAAGYAAVAFAMRHMADGRAFLISLFSAALMGVLIGGQVSLFVAALIAGGITAKRPWLAGVLLGCAAVIKPQSLLAAPIVLIAARQYRTIAWACATAVVTFAWTVILWGFDPWPRWLVGLKGFPGYLRDHGLEEGDRGVYGLLLQFGLPGWLYVIGIPLGIACAWLTFRRPSAPVDRYIAFAVSTILMSPYTLGYDLAALSIAATAVLLDKEREPAMWLAAALILSSMLANFGVILFAVLIVRRHLKRAGPSTLPEGTAAFA